jgi:hypothetical protein
MTERPILFSAEMVRAILDGRKTQTRRKMKPAKAKRPKRWLIDDAAVNGLVCPYGEPGDLLWVREAWRVHKSYDVLNAARVYGAMGGDVAYCVDYLATPRNEDFWGRGRPSIHMPRWASRITLRITDVRVERLQAISEDDARAEGCPYPPEWAGRFMDRDETAKTWFKSIWNTINGPGAWDANPWVWAISFERVKP